MALRRYLVLPLLLVLATLGMVACGGDDDDGGGGFRVMTSTTIIADLVEQVGGDHVDVTSLVPRSADVHTFSLSPGDIRALSAADVVFIGGAGLEAGFSGEIERNAGGPVVTLTDGMDLKPFAPAFAHGNDDDAAGGNDSGGGQTGTLDPHFWMDIGLTIEAVGTIRDALTDADPAHGAAYKANADVYTNDLQRLDQEIKTKLAALPENRRYLVTFHDAYGYFADRYGLTVMGFVVESAEEEPAAGDYSNLVQAIKDHDVPYIFIEPQFDARVVEQLADDTGAEVRTIPNDALSDDYPTYVDLMKGMADAIAR
jgi:ABC-type Zn uptake system ZnuABC Zn-binding protein ZnuA